MTNRRRFDVLLCGVGGYGFYYLEQILKSRGPGDVRLCGVVDPFAEKGPSRERLRAERIPVFSSSEDFFTGGRSADLTVIASPIADHAAQTMTALQAGSHVLCEKPLAAVVQDVDELIRARDAAGRRLLVGFQWSFSRSVQRLKADIRRGRLGRPLRARTLCFWPRDTEYYRRNDWAGRLRDPRGRWVLDSPAQNAMAHFLHNLLYLLGDQTETSAVPARLEAELYRIYPLENADSAACRVITAGGVECLFYASHAVPSDVGPMFAIDFEEGRVVFGEGEDTVTALDAAGRRTDYGSPEDDDQFRKLHAALAAAGGDGPVVCGPEAARSHTLCVNGIQESAAAGPGVLELRPGPAGRQTAEGRMWSEALADAMSSAYREGRLPSEIGVAWAEKGRPVDLTEYAHFPGGRPPPQGKG